MANEATPGVRFTAGQSHQQIREMLADLTGVRDMLKDIAAEGKAASAAVGGIKAPRASGQRRPAQPAEPAEPARNIFAGLVPGAGASEADWRAAGKKLAHAREKALMEGMDLNRVERQTYSRVRSVAGGIAGREREAALQGPLGRLVNFAGWSPFMPGGNMMYLLQMALGEMGAGLPLAGVAAGMGVAGLGALGLSANAFAVQAQRTGQQTIAATGAPPFSAATFVTGADEARLLEQRAGQLRLTGPQSQQAVSALAAGGLNAADAFGNGLDQTATLVNAFGLSVQDAANVVTTMRVQMNRSTEETSASIAAFGKVAQATGQPLAALGQIAAQTPNLLANLSGQDVAVAASVARAMAGSTQGAIGLESVANASGAQALSIAAQMGLTDQQFTALQGTAGGNKRIDDFVVATVQRSLRQSGGSVDQAMLVANALLGTSFDKATFTRLANLAPGFSTTAFNQAMNAPAVPPTPGNLNAAVANQLPGVNNVANPWNVKDVAMNAANVVITGGLGNVGTSIDMLVNPQNYTDAQKRQIVNQQGIAGSQLPGQPGGGLGDRLIQAEMAIGRMLGIPLPRLTDAQLPGGGGPSPGGGGGGGGNLGTITLRVDFGNGRVQSIPVAIQNGRPSQQFTQYVRGQQYP